MEVSSESVFYQLENNKDAPLQKILKTDILIIKKADGTKLDFSTMSNDNAANKASQQPSISEQSGITQVKIGELSTEAKAANEALIAKMNAHIKPLDEQSGNKISRYAYGRISISDNSIMSSEDLEVSIVTGYLFKKNKQTPAVFRPFWNYYGGMGWTQCNPAIRFTVRNRTQQTVYLDLANTFYVSLGRATCLYVPSSTTTTTSGSTGGSLNLGAVTGALGLGGMVGTLASGVNVGGGTTTGTSNTTYAQRIVAIPPQSSIDLTPQYIFCNETKEDLCTGCKYRIMDIGISYAFKLFINMSDEGLLLCNRNHQIEEHASPMKFSFTVAYSKTEDCAQTKTQSINMYLSNIYGQHLFSKTKKNNGFNNNELLFDTKLTNLRSQNVIL